MESSYSSEEFKHEHSTRRTTDVKQILTEIQMQLEGTLGRVPSAKSSIIYVEPDSSFSAMVKAQ